MSSLSRSAWTDVLTASDNSLTFQDGDGDRNHSTQSTGATD